MSRRFTRKARGYGAGKVIVSEQVDDDEDARRDGEPWPRNGRDDDVDLLRLSFLHTRDVTNGVGVKIGERDIRKQSVPSTNSRVALATKKGPAAPVTQSPQRSTRLKQAKTKWGRGQGMTRVVVTGVKKKNCCTLARSTLKFGV